MTIGYGSGPTTGQADDPRAVSRTRHRSTRRGRRAGISPGVNDPYTAISCIDRLGAVLCTLAEKVIPLPYRHDEDGRLRVVADAPPPSGASP